MRREFSNGRLPHKFSIYMVFFELLPMVRDALAVGDADTARRIFSFAEWCSKQRSGEIDNAAGVAFYEHLFDRHEDWEAVIPYLSTHVICHYGNFWEVRPRSILSQEDLQELRQRLDYDRICDSKIDVNVDLST